MAKREKQSQAISNSPKNGNLGQTHESSTGDGHAGEHEDWQVTRSTASQKLPLEVTRQNKGSRIYHSQINNKGF